MIRLNKEWGGSLMLAMFSGALFVLALIYGLFLMIKDRNVTKKKLKRMTDNRLLTLSATGCSIIIAKVWRNPSCSCRFRMFTGMF